MHFALQFLPIIYALGVTVTFLTVCCPGASGNYGWPGVGAGCSCPAAQFTWAQSRKQGRLCGYPELTSPSSPPVYYKTLTWSGGMTQVVNYPVNNLSGDTMGGSETFFGLVTVPPDSDYTLTVNQFETWVNTVTGTDSMSPPDMSTETNGLTTTACAETQAAVMTGYATLTTVIVGSYTPYSGPNAGVTTPVSTSGTVPHGPGAWAYAASAEILLWGSLIDTTHVPFGGVPNITDDTSYGGITGGIVSSTSQAFIGNDTISGEIDQVISNAVDEATVLGAETANTVTFDGGVMGGSGGWNSQSGGNDYPSSVGGGGPGGGVDWCGPAWADRVGRQLDQISSATFGINVSNLVASLPMKCTVQVYRATYAVDTGNPLNPSFGTPESVGSPIVFTFTPSSDTYTIGPGENVISGDAPQGWIYGAKIVAVEPQ